MQKQYGRKSNKEDPSKEGSSFKRSELEGSLQESTKVVELVIFVVLTATTEGSRLTISQITVRTAEVVDSRSHRNVVSDLELIPPLPGVVAISNVGVF